VDGEWAQSRVLQVQFHNIKGNALDQFKDVSAQAIVAPAQYKSGNFIYPYSDALK
jgi:branched-chain amino acid transport system substrate-binding protein